MKYRLALALAMLLASQFLAALSIQKISFSSELELPEPELIKATGLKVGEEYSPERIAQAQKALRQYLNALAEYYVQIPYPELIPLSESELQLHFPLYRLASAAHSRLHILGLKYFSESSLKRLINLDSEAYYPLNALPGLMQRIVALYQERGYLFAAAELDSLVLDGGLTAYIIVEEGQLFKAKNYYFRGNTLTKESTILKNSALGKETEITPDKLRQAEQNLILKSYIQQARIIPIDDESLLFEISEGKMTFLEFVLGIGSEGGKSRLSGMANIDFRNLWGTDRGISLYWRNTPAALSELSFAYHESGHPAWPLEADLRLWRSEQDSTWVQSKIAADIYYRSLYNKLGVGAQQNSVWPGAQSSAIQKEDYWALSAFWSYQKLRGDEISQKGQAGSLLYQYQFRTGEDNSSLEAEYRLYQPIKGRLGSQMRAALKGYAQMPEADYELFSLGGFKSLRGYREAEFSSWRLGWVNLELRYNIQPRMWVYAFFDQGFLGQVKDKYKVDLFAVGGGLSAGTRMGILSLGYGLPYRDKGFSSMSLGTIHLGLDIAL